MHNMLGKSLLALLLLAAGAAEAGWWRICNQFDTPVQVAGGWYFKGSGAAETEFIGVLRPGECKKALNREFKVLGNYILSARPVRGKGFLFRGYPTLDFCVVKKGALRESRITTPRDEAMCARKGGIVAPFAEVPVDWNDPVNRTTNITYNGRMRAGR